MTYSQAADALGAQTLNAQPGTDEYSDTVPAGQVIRTEPASRARRFPRAPWSP